MDDDDWGLSCEELDSLERNAVAQLASRNKPSSSTAVSRDFESPRQTGLGSQESMSSPSQNAQGSLRIRSSPAKQGGREIKVRVFKDEPEGIAVGCAYHQDVVAVLRTVSGKRWDQTRKLWSFPEAEVDAVVRALRSLSQLQLIIEVEPPLSVSAAVLCGDLMPGDGAERSPKRRKLELFQDMDPNSSPRKTCKVRLILHNSGSIAAKFDYDPEVVSACRKIPKADWHAKERLWMFPVSSLAEAETTFKNVSTRSVKVEPLVPLVKRALQATVALPDLQEKYDSIPEGLKNTLMDFQVDGVRFSLQHGGRVLIADEMGLGKTLQALAVVSCLTEDWPVLIIVPSSLRLNWATMLEKWLQIHPCDITIVMSQGGSRQGYNIIRVAGKKDTLLDGLFTIVSYDVLTKLEEAISMAHFKIVIADESHYMKNPDAKRTNACVPILQKAKFAILLTGTPALSRPIEMFKQLQALQPSVYSRMEEYGRRYCMGGYFGMWQGASNHEELHALVKSTVMIRRLKKDVMRQLPRKRREQVFISLEEKGARKLHQLFTDLDVVKREHRAAVGKKDTEEAHRLNFAERQLLAKIYTTSAEAKLPAVQDYITTIIEAGCKFLVFGHHQSVLDGIQDLLKKKKVRFIRIDGKTAASTRQDLVRSFQEDSGVLVALLGIHAAGVGLTLTAASTVIFAEMSWTPGDLVQAEDRVHRIGQESAVNIYYLHATGSIDDLIWDAVQHKLENLGQVLDGEGDSSMKVASGTKEQALSSSQGQETLDAYVRPCESSAVDTSEIRAYHSHVAEVMTDSQAQATLDAFLRPFDMGTAVSPE